MQMQSDGISDMTLCPGDCIMELEHRRLFSLAELRGLNARGIQLRRR